MTDYCIGIDLGTTYSCLAYIDEDGDPVVEKNFEQEDTTPSVILFNENGEIIVGSPAKDMAMMYPPERIITSIKRQMGTDYEVDIDGEKYNPIMLSAVILRKMINDFNENHGCDVKKAVITCPAYFGQNERDATKTAGTIAGLDDVTVINEPTAAAISFGFGNAADGKKRVLVYDLGGGTFDVTILEIDGSSFTAVATDGERLLGGKDWDAVISKIIKEKVAEESGIDIETLDEDEDIPLFHLHDARGAGGNAHLTARKADIQLPGNDGADGIAVTGQDAVPPVHRGDDERFAHPLVKGRSRREHMEREHHLPPVRSFSAFL